MPKLRVYQLARELNRDNTEIIRELQHMGVPVTSHSNTVEDRLADRLRKELGIFTGQAGKAATTDEIVEVFEAPAAVEAAPAAPPTPVVEEAPRPEAKAEPKAEPKTEPKIAEKIAEPVAPAAKVAAPPAPPVTPPPVTPKVE